MAGVGEAVQPGLILRRAVHGVEDAVADLDAAQRQVTAGDPFGEGQDVRFDAETVQREHLAGAPEAADHLVGDQQNVVLVADGAHTRKIVVRRHEYAADALHRLGDHRGHRLRPFTQDRLLQIARRSLAHRLAFLQVALVAVWVGRVAVDEVGHQRAKHLVIAGNAGGAGGGQGDAVIGLAAGDDLDLVRLPLPLPEIAGRLERGVVAFRAAAGEEGRLQAGVGVAGELVGQFAGG